MSNSTPRSGFVIEGSTSDEPPVDDHPASRDNRTMKQLGTLEADVMELVWDAAPEQLSVHDILAAMADRQLAYTTILTVVTNLHSKGFLTRTKVSRAYHYTATNTREQVTSQALRDILDSSDDPTAVLMHFARTATPEETDALRRNLPRKARR